MGINYFSSGNVQHHFLEVGDIVKGMVTKKFMHIIWLATMWCLWRMRNYIIFRGDCANVTLLVDQIVYFSWFWFIDRLRSSVDLVFSDWCKNPLDCFIRI
jgi:hypothetical protein